ncbi:hypothetical protein [Salinigranum sp.]|uniref:transcriptional regulator FilR1 domain-containing protein n=1 Tax=Salinigranum sp. TaxID=1966351 RepID=UPI003568D7ED
MPVILTIADETVIIGAVDGGGRPQGVIVTDDESVRTWAEETVDGYLAAADPMTLEDVETRAVAADGGT